MSKTSNAVVYALICGLILFIVLPHALAALDRRRFLKRLRRAFENGTLQPRWPSEAAMHPCETRDMCEVWVNSVGLGNDEIDLPFLGGFTTLNNDHDICAFVGQHPAASKNEHQRQTLRDRLMAVYRKRKPNDLPTTTAPTTTAQTTNNNSPHRLQGTLQFATLITMPSPRTSKLYNTSVNTTCSLSYPTHPPITSNGHNGGVTEVSEPRVPPPFPDDSSFLSTLHIGVCTKSLTLDGSVIPSPPPPLSPSETETASRDAPLLPMYRIGYAGGAGVMIVQAPPRRSRDEEDEEWRHQAWMWRAF